MPFDISLSSLPFFQKQESPSFVKKLSDAIPIEGVTFLAASLGVRILSVSLSAPLLGIGVSMIASRMLLKAIDVLDHRIVVDLTKEACKINRTYPSLQAIVFVSALAFSFTSQSLSFLIGVSLGSFGSIILDVERHKLMQQWNRMRFG
jgi:hypothetical protein